MYVLLVPGVEAPTPTWMRTAADRKKGGLFDHNETLCPGETSEDMRPWADRLRDAQAAYKGRQIVIESSKRFKRAAQEQRYPHP
eukprot:COSAG05_NODE_2508_length_2971_cov_1.405641_2_plen_84_part_00